MSDTSTSNHITFIPIDSTTMITTSPAVDRDKRREESLCKFIREYMLKVAQIVVAARSVSSSSGHRRHGDGHDDSLSSSWNNLEAPSSQWFRVETPDSVLIRQYVEEQCLGHWDCRHSDFTLSIDISLSAAPLAEHVLLERWTVKFKRDRHGNGSLSECNDPSLIYKRMTMQIRSILSYLRLLATHCIVQCQEESTAAQSMLLRRGRPHREPVPFALYHLIYARHNRPNDRISNFVGNSKSFCFEPLRTAMGTLRSTVFYGADIRTDFEWLIRSVPGKNPPIDDNLSQHIDARSRYWDKVVYSSTDSEHKRDGDSLPESKRSAVLSHRHHTAKNGKSPKRLAAATKLTAPFQVVDRWPDTAPLPDPHSPPIKSLNAVHFHESPVLHTHSPALDPLSEMERIRLSGSTVFGAAPPVISLADVSANRESMQSSRSWGSGSQLLRSIVREQRKGAGSQLLRGIDRQHDAHSDGPISNDRNEHDLTVTTSDHADIQEELFEGYDDEEDHGALSLRGHDGQRRSIAKMSAFITMCSGAEHSKLPSFERRDCLLSDAKGSDQNDECLKMLCRHFEARQQRLTEMKRTASNVLESSLSLQQ